LQTWRWKFSLAAATAVAAVVALLVSVHAEDVLSIVAARQAAMKSMAANVKIINDYSQNKADQAAAIIAAQLLVASAKTVPTLFPPGTGMTALPGRSGAKGEIWTSRQAEFAADAAGLVSMAMALLDAVRGGDPASVRQKLLSTGKDGCSTCHDSFRVRI
jgi:cytochrome c556